MKTMLQKLQAAGLKITSEPASGNGFTCLVKLGKQLAFGANEEDAIRYILNDYRSTEYTIEVSYEYTTVSDDHKERHKWSSGVLKLSSRMMADCYGPMQEEIGRILLHADADHKIRSFWPVISLRGVAVWSKFKTL